MKWSTIVQTAIKAIRLRAMRLRDKIPWLGRAFDGALKALIAIIVVIGVYLLAIHRPLNFSDEVWVIERGETLGQVAEQLVEREVIRQTLLLRAMAWKGNRGRNIRAGEYRFPAHTSLNKFLTSIVSGKYQIGIKVTIKEGWTFQQMREELNQSEKLKVVTAEMSGQQIMALLGHPELHPEGQFFPETYTYTKGQKDLEIYRQAFELMQNKLNAAWENRDDDLFITSKEEALILASIIEKESSIVDEQAKIAGVFYNRLKKNIRLQTDPTVIYGAGDKYKGQITRSHLDTDTPYNTYRRNGLTPTPISLPSETALSATVNPQSTDAYYFVAKGAKGHHFSETLEEHNQAVQKYREYQKSQSK